MNSIQQKKLLRSKNNRVIGGVCGGLGEYLEIDPIFVRLVFVLLFLAGGSSVLAYIILWIVIPETTTTDAFSQETVKKNVQEIQDKTQDLANSFKDGKNNSTLTVGILFLLLGFIFLMDNFNFMPWDYVMKLWPAAFVIIGILIIIKRR